MVLRYMLYIHNANKNPFNTNNLYSTQLVLHDIDIFMLDISFVICHDITKNHGICKNKSHYDMATHSLLLNVNYTLVVL